MNEMKIRPYQPDDFARLEAIHDPARRNELALAGLADAFLPLSIAAEREGLFEYTVFVAEYADEVAGFVAFNQEEIAWLYVDVRHTRKGIGRALVEFALSQMGEKVCIEVLSGNAPAIALYTACGFQIEDTISGVMPGNEAFRVTVHLMRRVNPPAV